MTGLLGANALMLVAGIGLVGFRRIALAYLAGIALCGILAAESRAAQNDYQDIHVALAHLHGMIEGRQPGAGAP